MNWTLERLMSPFILIICVLISIYSQQNNSRIILCVFLVYFVIHSDLILNKHSYAIQLQQMTSGRRRS